MRSSWGTTEGTVVVDTAEVEVEVEVEAEDEDEGSQEQLETTLPSLSTPVGVPVVVPYCSGDDSSRLLYNKTVRETSVVCMERLSCCRRRFIFPMMPASQRTLVATNAIDATESALVCLEPLLLPKGMAIHTHTVDCRYGRHKHLR